MFLGGPAAAKTVTIGVLIANTHPGLEADQNGFAKALKEAGIQATFDRQNAAGHKAVMILKEGKKPGEIPSGSSELLDLYISQKNAKRRGVEIPEEFLKKADRVFK